MDNHFYWFFMQNIMATASPPVEELPSGLPPLPSYEEAVRLPNIPNPMPPPPDYAKTIQMQCSPQVNSPPPVISAPQGKDFLLILS